MFQPEASSATVVVAGGSTAVTWEVATIVADGLSKLGLPARLGEPDDIGASTPIIVFGQAATITPRLSPAQARKAILLLLAGPGTEAFDATVALAQVARCCFAVSPRTVRLLRDQDIPTERFVLGHCSQWDYRGADDHPRSIDVAYVGELDRRGRRVLAKIAPELGELRSHLDIRARRPEGSEVPATFESGPILGDSAVTVIMNRWANTTLDWPTAVRAMCSGSLVIAERSTGYGELVPGKHFLMNRAESLGPVLRAALADPIRVADMAAAAYELCREELRMSDSLERLATAVRRSRASRSAAPRRTTPVAAPEGLVRARPRLQFKVVGPAGEPRDSSAEIDVVCIEHPYAGPFSLTRESLAGHAAHVNLHVARIKVASAGDPASRDDQDGESIGTAVAEARNELVRQSSAPLVMFVDAGDELLGGALGQLVPALQASPESDIGVPLVAFGSDDLLYPARPESDMVHRGYIVRRSYLDRLGPFVGDGAGTAGVDRTFWRRATARGGNVAVLPQVSVRLWQQSATD